jgi:hypothetical protein
MAFPLDPTNLGYTKVEDTTYDSKLVAALGHLGIDLPKGFGAVRGHIQGLTGGTITAGVRPVVDKDTGKYVQFAAGTNLVCLRAAVRDAFSTVAGMDSLQLGLSASTGSVSSWTPLTAAVSGTHLTNTGLTFQETGTVSSAKFVKSPNVFLVAEVTASVAQTTGNVDVSVLHM